MPNPNDDNNNNHNIMQFLFSSEPFYYDSELPDLWLDELAEILSIPAPPPSGSATLLRTEPDSQEVDISIHDLLFKKDCPNRQIGLGMVREYAEINTRAEDRILPKDFYLALSILADAQQKSSQDQNPDEGLHPDSVNFIQKVLNENWLDPASREVLGSLLR